MPILFPFFSAFAKENLLVRALLRGCGVGAGAALGGVAGGGALAGGGAGVDVAMVLFSFLIGYRFLFQLRMPFAPNKAARDRVRVDCDRLHTEVGKLAEVAVVTGIRIPVTVLLALP